MGISKRLTILAILLFFSKVHYGKETEPQRVSWKDQALLIDGKEIETLFLLSPNHLPLKVFIPFKPTIGDGHIIVEEIKLVHSVAEIIATINSDPARTAPKIELVIIQQDGEDVFSFWKQNLLRRPPNVKIEIISVAEAPPWLRDTFMPMVAIDSSGTTHDIVMDTTFSNEYDPLREIFQSSRTSILAFPDDHIGNTGNAGGNVLSTPSDMLVLGNNSDRFLRDFFTMRGYDESLILADTSWLPVGHVDEFLSVLPDPINPNGIIILRASPLLALKLLKTATSAELASHMKHFPNSTLTGALNLFFLHRRLNATGDFLSDESTETTEATNRFLKDQINYEKRIERNIELLIELARMRSPNLQITVDEIPVLYDTRAYSSSTFPNPINLLSLGSYVMLPDPFFIPFRNNIVSTLAAYGQTVYFLNTKHLHGNGGGLHCRTQVQRDPRNMMNPKLSRCKYFFAER